jgi:hypothetical protein
MTSSTSPSSTTTRIDHSDAYVLDRHNHVNGIENFWNQAKRTLNRNKAHTQPIQRHSESPLSALSQADRISLQLPKTQPTIANPQTPSQTQALAYGSGTTPKTFIVATNDLDRNKIAYRAGPLRSAVAGPMVQSYFG